MKNTVGNLNTESNIAEQEHLTNDQEPLGPYSRENIVGRKKKKTSDDGQSELLTTLNKCIETRKNKEDYCLISTRYFGTNCHDGSMLRSNITQNH